MTPLTNFTLQPGQYYLVQESQGAGGTTSLPTPDAIGTIAVSSTSTKVVLVNNTTLVTGICPNPGAAGIVDLIGYGATDCFEGAAPAPTLSNTTAALRRNEGCFDTNQNANDIVTGSPTPRNSSTPVHDCTSLSAYGTANPSSVLQGGSTTLTVYVAAGQNPDSSGVTVTADLSQIGGSATQSFGGSGSVFTFGATVPVATSPGLKSLPVTVADAQGRTTNTNILVSVLSLAADHVTISQVYGGGGNASATYTNDYVELYNPTANTITITGWSLQYASAAGTSWTNKQPLGGIIGPGEYYLVQLASGGANGAPLPVSPNISGDINMSATTGKIALVNNSTNLTGDCPLGNSHIVDFVGYGSGATCHEGTANAPAPSNSTAIFRKNNGALDSDQNSTDFQTGTPSPRRTATIVELGPWVSGTDPGSGDNTIPYDATITVNFSEPVTVDAGWYNINCSVSGAHNSATEAHFSDLKTYAVTPNVSFQFGEQCTVTIPKTSVHDVDTDDSGTDTDSLFEDYTWSFTVVGAGQPAPYPPSVHLTMGDPGCGTPFGCAAASTSQPNNYLMEKPTYSLSYNRDKATPNWVSWHLDSSWYGTLARVDTFRPDPKVDPSWYRVQAFDYSGSGFDRGHMTPNADRDNQNRIPINQETYLMSNMIPQAPGNNQGPWAALEGDLRTIADGGNELYIVSGPLGVGGSGSNGGTTTTIANGNITVPAFTWKVALVLPKAEGDDTARVTCSTRTIAVLMPNLDSIRPNTWQTYLTTVDNVEQQTGFNFFSNLPPAIQACIEAGTNGSNPPGTAGQSVTTAEDNSVNITLTASSPGGPLTYTIVTPPAHGQLTGSGANRNYAPDLNFNGTDSFTFKVNDGTNDSNTSTVTITVTEVNDPPTAANDSASTNQDTPLNIPAANLTTNDSPGPANEASQTLIVTSVSATGNTHGTVVLNSGTITYTPAAGYDGPASFTYQVCDNGTTNGVLDSLCTTGTVNVTVEATSPVLAANGATLTQEGLTPANNAVDPSERVSMNLKLINNGNGATSNLVGTLQASANVVAPSGPISFGVIAANGGTAGRDFSFTAVGNCGDLITLALQLQDGATDFGTVFYSVRLGADSGGGNYVCTTPSGSPNVVVTTTLTRQNATTVVANISIQNIGPVTANNVVMNNAKLGATNGTPLPQSAGNLLPGATFTTTVNFTNSTPGASSNLVVGGTYTGGTFSTTKRVTIP
jgi:endonuclease G